MSLFFLIPLKIFGINHFEEYTYHFYTLELLAENKFKPFLFYYDLLGPGTKLPIGHGFYYLFPTTILIKFKSVFFFCTIVFGIFLQVFYIQKLLKLFKLENNLLIISLYILSISNFSFLFDFDYLDMFVSFSTLPVFLYYSINVLEKKNYYHLLLIFISLAFIILNSHLAYNFIIILFLISFFIVNNFFYIFKNIFFYFCIIIFFLIISEYLFYLVNEFVKFENIPRPQQWSFEFKYFLSSIYFFLQFLNDYIKNISFIPNNNFSTNQTIFFPFSGLLIYVSIVEIFIQIKLKESKRYYYLNYIFLFFLFFSFLDFTKSIKILSGPYVLRDICVFLSLFLFLSFVKRIKISKFKNLIIFFALLFSLTFYWQNISLLKKESTFTYLNPFENFKEEILYKELKKINNFEYKKTYISPMIYDYFNKHNKSQLKNFETFQKLGIYHLSDLNKFNIYPYNYLFKSVEKNKLVKPSSKMYSELKPSYEQISNEIFLDLFLIKYLLILESELKNINFNDFKVIFSVKISNSEKIYFLERKKIFNIVADLKKNITPLIDTCTEFETVFCLLKIENFFYKSNNIDIKRLDQNHYEISNKSEENIVFVLPFLYDKNWKIKNSDIKNLENSLMLINLKPKSMKTIYYNDITRFILKSISLCCFFIAIFLLIYLKKSKKKFK